jgi:endonuclease YncB( thermonuclease family)
VRSGQAAVYERYCDRASYFQAEREARKAKRGIWSRRGEHQTPWRYRQRNAR